MAIRMLEYEGVEVGLKLEVSNRVPNVEIIDTCLCNYTCCGNSRKQYFSRDELENVTRILNWIKGETEYVKLKNWIALNLEDFRLHDSDPRRELFDNDFSFFDALFRNIAMMELEIDAPDDVEVSWFMPDKPWKWSDQAILYMGCGHEVVGYWLTECDVYTIVHSRNNQRYVPQPGDHRYENETDGICPICEMEV